VADGNFAQVVTGFGSIIPYWAFMLATAGGLYKGMVFVGGHFPENFKSDLSRWLDGFYETTWSTHFCRLFDIVFGERTFSAKRFARSSVASILSVFALYVLFAQVLGVLGARTFGSMPLWQALLIGALVNILPDYFSLIATRWLLERFGKVRSVLGQIAMLIASLIFSGTIILVAIYTYSLVADERPPSPVEIVALFSVYSIFFYSTFLTSIWAWVYCLSGWFVRLFTKAGLGNLLNIREDPVRQIALVSAAIMVLGGMAMGPILQPQKGSFSNAFDDFICGLDLKACFLAARAAGDTERVAHFMELACTEEAENLTCGDRIDASFSLGDVQEIDAVWKRACDGGFVRACRAHGYYLARLATPSSLASAVDYYRMACDGGDLPGCNNLGIMYENGTGVDHSDLKHAADLYRQACDGGAMRACNNLGIIYENGTGMDRPDPARSVKLYRQACDGGNFAGCNNLGILYENGTAVDHPDPAQAVALYQLACDGGEMMACKNLGDMYENGMGVDRPDLARAIRLYRQACDGGAMRGCTYLGIIYENGTAVDHPDPAQAVALYQRACDDGEMTGCNNLGRMYDNGAGVGENDTRAAELYKQACDGREMTGCANLGIMYEAGVVVEKNIVRAVELYQQACDGGVPRACGWADGLK